MPCVTREECLKHFDMFESSDCRVLLVEAQAGQGKTVFAEQCAQHTFRPHLWVCCDEKDADPVLLFEKLTTGLANHVLAFRAVPELKTLHHYGHGHEILYFGLVRLTEILSRQSTPLLLIFDDLHLISRADQSLELLQRLVHTSPPQVKLLLLSRYRLARQGRPLIDLRMCMRVDNAMLAFSREETAVLFSDVLGNPLPTDQVSSLHRLTQGWVTGLLLAGEQSAGDLQGGMDSGQEKLRSYFLNLIRQQNLSRDQLLYLALLDEVPSRLVQRCMPSALESLKELYAKHMFVRLKRNTQEETFLFHHLFRDSLRAQAEESLPRHARFAWLKTAGEWLVQAGYLEDGLRCFAQGRHWERISQLLKRYGDWLIINNRHATLLSGMESIPEEVVGADPWLSLYAGEVCFAVTPRRSLVSYLRARELFASSGERQGELRVICRLISYHVAIDGRFGRQKRLVLRGEALFRELEPTLGTITALRAAHALAMGFLWVFGDAELGAKYNRTTRALFDSLDNDLQAPFTMLNVACAELFSGDLEACLELMDTYFPAEKYSVASPTVRFVVERMFLRILQLRGEGEAYAQHKAILEQCDSAFCEHSYLGKLPSILDLDIRLSEGDPSAVLDLARRSEADPKIDAVPHLLSQVLQYKALALACLGHHQEAWIEARRSLKLRARAGGPCFRPLNLILAGAALARGPFRRTARKLLDKGIRASQELRDFHARPAGLASRAALALDEGRYAEAVEDIASMLWAMERFRNRHFPGWEPVLLERLLPIAVTEGLSPGFAKALARERLHLDILDSGETVPLMRINTAGELRIHVPRTGRTCRAEDIRPKPLQLLIKLLQHRDGAVRLDSMLESMSLDEADDVSRSRLDTLLSRLRADISAATGLNASRFIVVCDGRICLKHCVFEQNGIQDACQKGLHAARLGHAFSAMLYLAKAFHGFLNSLPGPGTSTEAAVSPEAVPLLSEGAMAWAGIMRKTGKTETALSLIDRMLGFDPLNDALQRDRYNILIELGRPARAMQGLREYRTFLEQEGFDPEAIEAIVDAIW